MKLFKCQECGQTVFFENRRCERCNLELGYLSQASQLLALVPEGKNYSAAKAKHVTLRYCANATQAACNWLIPAESPERFCAACRHNRTIPDLSLNDNLSRWQRMEIAKHRLFYTLIALGLPLANLNDDPVNGLAFDFLAEAPEGGKKILTGHDEGLITINLNEADDIIREKLRNEMGEPYRTLLGHFRHEVGHYFWNILVRDGDRLEECREVFGDDSQDYAAALQRHYAEGPPANWVDSYISAYATAHPWEDFAETWAHYLHIVDTLETASAFGLQVHPRGTKNQDLHANIDFDPHHAGHIETLTNAWLPLTFALNSLNRSMGHSDLYPFILSKPVIRKLQFIHEIIHGETAEESMQTEPVTQKRNSQRENVAVPEQPPSQPPAPAGPSPIRAPEPGPGPDIRPPIEEPPSELPPQEIPPPPMPGEPPPLQA